MPEAIEEFMDGLLSAFEDGNEEIARRRKAAGGPPANVFQALRPRMRTCE
jgi:hypothetical protein